MKEILTWICTGCKGEFLGGISGNCPNCEVIKLSNEKFVDEVLAGDHFNLESDYYQKNEDNYLPPEDDDGSNFGY